MVYGCNSETMSAGTKFCVNGETFTVGSSWDSVGAGGASGATVNLAPDESFPRKLFNQGDALTVGPCGAVEGVFPAVNLAGGSSLMEYPLSAPTAARYLRVKSRPGYSANGGWWSVWEVEARVCQASVSIFGFSEKEEGFYCD